MCVSIVDCRGVARLRSSLPSELPTSGVPSNYMDLNNSTFSPRSPHLLYVCAWEADRGVARWLAVFGA